MKLFVVTEADAAEGRPRYAAVRSDGVLVWSTDLYTAKVFAIKGNAKDFAIERLSPKTVAVAITAH